jgi:hypothetical protein
MRLRSLNPALLTIGLALTACADTPTQEGGAEPTTTRVASSQPRAGAPATWSLDANAEQPSSEASTLNVLVTGAACSGGEPRPVLPPTITRDEDRVVVTFSVEPLPPGNYNCQGNPGEPYTVNLGEPIGSREVVDGLCLGTGPLVESAFCEGTHGVRWQPGD